MAGRRCSLFICDGFLSCASGSSQCSRAWQSLPFCACSAAVKVLGSAPCRDPPLTETITEEQGLAKQANLCGLQEFDKSHNAYIWQLAMPDESQLVDIYSLEAEVSSVSSPIASWIGSVQSDLCHFCLITCMPDTLSVKLRTYHKKKDTLWYLCITKASRFKFCKAAFDPTDSGDTRTWKKEKTLHCLYHAACKWGCNCPV